jgi:hypothetical protein
MYAVQSLILWRLGCIQNNTGKGISMNRVLPIGAALLFALSTSSFSSEQSSIYLGLSGVLASYKSAPLDTNFPVEPNQRIDDSSSMLELQLGYQINSKISFELAYADFGKVTEELKNDLGHAFFAQSNFTEQVKFKQYSASIIYEQPVSNNLSLIGLLGYTYFDAEQKRMDDGLFPVSSVHGSPVQIDDGGVSYGLGGKYSFNEKYRGKLMWKKSETSGFDVGAVYLGVEMVLKAK